MPDLPLLRAHLALLRAHLTLLCVLSLQVMEAPADLSPDALCQEVSLMRQCSHKRIVPLYGVVLQVGACLA